MATEANTNQTDETEVGLDQNIAGALTYLLGFITGIIFLVIEDNEFVRFHAAQSIVVFGGIFALSIALSFLGPILGAAIGFFGTIVGLLSLVLNLASFVLWVVLMFKAYSGERFELPIAADIAADLT